MYRLGTAILVLVPDKSRHWLVHAADNIGWDTVLYSVWLLCRSRLPAAQHTMRVRRARIPIPCLGLVSLIPEFASRLALPVPESRRPIPAPNPRRPSMPRYLSRHQSSAPLASTSPFRLVRCCLYSWNAPTPSPSPPPQSQKIREALRARMLVPSGPTVSYIPSSRSSAARLGSCCCSCYSVLLYSCAAVDDERRETAPTIVLLPTRVCAPGRSKRRAVSRTPTPPVESDGTRLPAGPPEAPRQFHSYSPRGRQLSRNSYQASDTRPQEDIWNGRIRSRCPDLVRTGITNTIGGDWLSQAERRTGDRQQSGRTKRLEEGRYKRQLAKAAAL